MARQEDSGGLVPERARGRGRRSASIALINRRDGGIAVDPYRNIVFPNAVREQRLRAGHPKLLAFASGMSGIPYIRLSKIERGEVFARADELAAIAARLGVDAGDLLVDVEAEGFDIAAWFAPFAEGAALDDEAEARFALLLAAAVRARRDADARLTAPVIDAEFGIAPVILSRIENAQKGLARWNGPTIVALCRLFGVRDEAALRALVTDRFRDGVLARFLTAIPGAAAREIRTRQRVTALRRELSQLAVTTSAAQGPRTSASIEPRMAGAPATSLPLPPGQARRLVPVLGIPMADGLIALTPTGTRVEAMAETGPRAYGVRIGRATLGPGMPGQATVVVDPDRFAQAGGLALVRDGEGHRLLAVSVGRDGLLTGHSVNPPREIALDALPPADVAAVVAAVFL